MSFPDFQDAIVTSDDHYLMGRKLRPFCLEYQFWLEVVESPLLGYGESEHITAMDVEIASLICSAGYRENKRLPEKKAEYNGFFRKIRWGFKAYRTNIYSEEAKFTRYLTDYTSFPETHESSKKSAFKTFPDCLHVSTSLVEMGMYGGDLAKIWMMPLGEAHWYTLSHFRNEGVDVNLKTEHDRAFEQTHDEFMEQYRKMEEEKAKKAREEAIANGEDPDKPDDPEEPPQDDNGIKIVEL